MPLIGQSATNLAKNVWEYATRTLTQIKVKYLADATEYASNTTGYVTVRTWTDIFGGATVIILGWLLQADITTDGGGQSVKVFSILLPSSGMYSAAPRLESPARTYTVYTTETLFKYFPDLTELSMWNFPVAFPVDIKVQLYNSNGTAGTNYIKNIKVWIAYIEV